MERSTSDSNPFRSVLDVVPIATYCTNAAGLLTYFNPAAAEFSGRSPKVGVDRWCVTWKLFHTDGAPMPHDQCPMAVALKEGRKVWGMEAIAERPDGTRRPFTPYPTPLRDPEGNLIGGINMLLDLADRKTEYVSALLSFIAASDEMHSAIRDLSQPSNALFVGVMPVASCVACGRPITDDGNARIAFHVDCYQKGRHLAPSESEAWEAFARLRDAVPPPPRTNKIRNQKSKYI
jgi:PAS domain S-box-containing protein